MADRMTEAEVATLELPEGLIFQLFHEWWRVAGTGTDRAFALGGVAEAVANGHLPRAVYDWALRAYRGGDVPTVEQWDELVAAARKIVNDPYWLPLLRKASAALTPQPPPLPEIAECPRCGHECSVADLGATVAVVCKACNWEGPAKTEELAAINGHNYEAAKLRPEEEPKPQRKVCDTCRHGKKPASHPSCQTCFKAAAGERPAWEPKP